MFLVRDLVSELDESALVEACGAREDLAGLVHTHCMRKRTAEDLRADEGSLKERVFDACKRHDVDGNGYIAHGELSAIVRDLGFDMYESELSEAKRVLDTNKDGRVTYEEVYAYIAMDAGAAAEAGTGTLLDTAHGQFAHTGVDALLNVTRVTEMGGTRTLG
jgi:hypothetical protein